MYSSKIHRASGESVVSVVRQSEGWKGTHRVSFRRGRALNALRVRSERALLAARRRGARDGEHAYLGDGGTHCLQYLELGRLEVPVCQGGRTAGGEGGQRF